MSDTTRKREELRRRIWLAGLGAASNAEDGGESLFQSLIERGEALQKRLGDDALHLGESVRSTLNQARSSAGEIAESAFDRSLSGALDRLGIPSKREIDRLVDRIDELQASLERAAKAKTKAPERKSTKKKKKKVTKKKKVAKKKATAKKKPAAKKKSASRRTRR